MCYSACKIDQRGCFMKFFGWFLFGFFAIGVGLYPLFYLLFDMSQGFLSTKGEAILANEVWHYFFYQHILLGGIALLTGWTQFSQKIRSRALNVHRLLGKVYIAACMLSGIAGLYLAFFATGGIISSLGFGTLAVLWLISTSKAFLHIRSKRINDHRDWMIRSYALTFAAVTLRIWLPLSGILQMPFLPSYMAISWLCWVPNLLVAERMISKRKNVEVSASPNYKLPILWVTLGTTIYLRVSLLAW